MGVKTGTSIWSEYNVKIQSSALLLLTKYFHVLKKKRKKGFIEGKKKRKKTWGLVFGMSRKPHD